MSKQNKRPGGRDDASQKSSTTHEEVLALIKERRKYVDWIRALEAKREQTSPQAYERVHLDYQSRLDAVAAKLATHRDTLSAEQASLERKLGELDEEIQQFQDDRAETELRAHVGELTAAALTEALRVADTEIDRLNAKRNAVAKDLGRIAEFFEAADGTGATPAPPRPRGRGGFDELGFLNSVVGAEAGPPRPSLETKAEAAPVAESPPPLRPVEVPPVEPPATPPSRPTPVPGRPSTPPIPERPTTPPIPERPSTPTPSPTPEPPPTPTPEPPSVPVSPPRTSVAAEVVQADGAVEKAIELDATPRPTPRQSIAMQMASLTLDPDAKATPVRDSLGIIKTGDALPPSILADLQPGGASGGEKPFAANVASNNPLSLKSSGTGDVKTLKCRDCGAMNDPSEWYCERCGAELSSM